jgi:hypothetical protein
LSLTSAIRSALDDARSAAEGGLNPSLSNRRNAIQVAARFVKTHSTDSQKLTVATIPKPRGSIT